MRNVAARADIPDADADANTYADSYSDPDPDPNADADSNPDTNANANANADPHADTFPRANDVDTARGRCLSGGRWSGRDGVADDAALAVARVAKIHAAAERLTRRGGEPI